MNNAMSLAEGLEGAPELRASIGPYCTREPKLLKPNLQPLSEQMRTRG